MSTTTGTSIPVRSVIAATIRAACAGAGSSGPVTTALPLLSSVFTSV